MRSQRNMSCLSNLKTNRIYLQGKQMGFVFFVPLIIVLVLIPVLDYLSYRSNLAGLFFYEQFYSSCNQNNLVLLPLGSVIWLIYGKRNYIEAEGREIFATLPKYNCAKDFLHLLVFYCILVLLIHAVLWFVFAWMFFDFLRMLIIIIYVYGLTCLVLELGQSTMLALLCALFITVMAHNGSRQGLYAFPFYFVYTPVYGWADLLGFCPHLLTGIICFALAAYVPRYLQPKY